MEVLKRSNPDKRRCVEIALKEFGGMSDRAIAEMCGVGKTLASEVRSVQVVEKTSSIQAPRIGLDGKTRKMSAGTGRFCFVTVSDGSQTFGRKLRGAGIHRKYEP